MGKLIDADNLLADLKDKKKSLRESLNYAKREGETKWADELREQMQILTLIIDGVERGGYDPDPTPLPTIKPGDKEYVCCECKEPSSSNEWNIATLKVYGSDIYLIDDDDKAATTVFVCPKCSANVDFRNLGEVSHD